MTTISERVALGASFLDEHDPGWWREDVARAIDLNALDLSDTAWCVLGQRCPSELIANRLGIPVGDLTEDDRTDAYVCYMIALAPAGVNYSVWSSDHGFGSVTCDDFTPLGEAWCRVISARRRAFTGHA